MEIIGRAEIEEGVAVVGYTLGMSDGSMDYFLRVFGDKGMEIVERKNSL